MPEIRFGITKKLNSLLVDVADELGIEKSEYLKSLIITDLNNKLRKSDKGK